MGQDVLITIRVPREVAPRVAHLLAAGLAHVGFFLEDPDMCDEIKRQLRSQAEQAARPEEHPKEE